MLYEGIIYAAVLAMMLITNRRGRATRLFIPLVVFYWLCVSCCILYLAKDVYYFNTIDRYFLVGRSAWRDLIFLPVSRYTLIRGINYGALGFYAFAILFANAFSGWKPHTKHFNINIVLIGYFAFQALLYDPYVYSLIYKLCFPALMNAATFHHIEDGVHIALYICNLSLIVLSIIRMFRYALRRISLRIIHTQNIPIAIGYAVLLLFNSPVILMLPRTLTRVSVTAKGFVTYNTLPLGKVEWLYSAATVANVAAIILIGFLIIWRFKVLYKINSSQLAITQRIDAANTTSKAFCHYMKNELLALEADLEKLDPQSEQDRITIAKIQKQCERLYKRLDEVYQSTMQGSVRLVSMHILSPVHVAIDNLAGPLKEYQITLPDRNPKVMLDLSYFTICMTDLLRNAIEAAEGLPPDRRRIDITLDEEPGFWLLSIRDYGRGIDREVLPRLFTPFTSTKPIKKNWGISLSLVYRIVRAHGGDVTMENVSPHGAAIRILLPIIDELTSR